MLQHPPAGAIQNARLGKEVLEQYMEMFDALAQHYRPIPESPHSDEGKFTKYATATCDCAKALAPYQSPTYRAIVMTAPQGSAGNGEKVLTQDELASELAARGLPASIFGIDVPVLEPEEVAEGDESAGGGSQQAQHRRPMSDSS
jgi:hypothetical protein